MTRQIILEKKWGEIYIVSYIYKMKGNAYIILKIEAFPS